MLKPNLFKRDDPLYGIKKKVKLFKFRFAYSIISFCRWLPEAYYRNIAELGQSLEFSLWISREFSEKYLLFPNRYRLWKHIISSFEKDQEIIVLEFGVADGTATKWWLSECKNIVRWVGFDTFTGLPRQWRHFQAGTFTTKGNPPDINDPRVEWVTGEVENTFSSERVCSLLTQEGSHVRCVVLFDLDLYESTKHVLQLLMPHLGRGDVVYFDEAGDLDERRAFLEVMANNRITTHLVGATPMAMAIQADTDWKETSGALSQYTKQ